MGKIVLVGDGIGLPNGYAPSSRLKLLAASIKKEQENTEILIATPSEFYGRCKNFESQGFVEGVQYKYVSDVAYSRFSIYRRLQSVLGILKTCLYIYKDNSIETVFAYVRKMHLLFALSVVCKITNKKLILEICEWQESLVAPNWHVALNNRIFSRYAHRFVDGIVAISDFIEKKVRGEPGGEKVKVLVVPILCNPEEFQSPRKVLEKNLVFSGNLFYQETLSFIIKSFSEVSAKHPDCVLHIVGGGINEEFEIAAQNLIQKSSAAKRIKMLGYVSREKLLELYSQASLLLIPLFNDVVSSARFPTKIAEYLLSGAPVVTTNIGEVSKYMKDEVNCYLANEDSVDAFSKKIIQALEDERSIEVAREGRELALNNFGYDRWGEKIIKFFERENS